MAAIKISNLKPAGAELFEDGESFLSDLSVAEVDEIAGGLKVKVGLVIKTGVKISVASSPACAATASVVLSAVGVSYLWANRRH